MFPVSTVLKEIKTYLLAVRWLIFIFILPAQKTVLKTNPLNLTLLAVTV